MLWRTKPPQQFHKQLVHLCLLKFLCSRKFGKLVWLNPGSYNFRFPPVFGSCNSKMLLVNSWDNMDPFWKIWLAFIKVTRKNFYHHISFLLTTFSQNAVRDFFCNNSFNVKTIKFNRFLNRKTLLFHVSFKLVWLKREIKNISPH